MTLRPVATHWFELVTVHQELARVMECLSRTGAIELEARDRAADRLLFPDLGDAIKTITKWRGVTGPIRGRRRHTAATPGKFK